MARLAALLLWVVCGLIASGAFNASFRADFPDVVGLHTYKAARSDCALSVGLGLFGGPISLVESAFLTGFWYSGWTLSCQPNTPQ